MEVSINGGFHNGGFNSNGNGNSILRSSGDSCLRVSIHGDTPIAGWFMVENPTSMDDLGVPPYQETSIYINIIYIYICVIFI